LRTFGGGSEREFDARVRSQNSRGRERDPHFGKRYSFAETQHLRSHAKIVVDRGTQEVSVLIDRAFGNTLLRCHRKGGNGVYGRHDGLPADRTTREFERVILGEQGRNDTGLDFEIAQSEVLHPWRE